MGGPNSDEKWNECVARSQIVEAFVSAAREGHKRRFIDAFQALESSDHWQAALRGIARGPVTPANIQRAFLHAWGMWEALRQEVDNDEVVLQALPKLLPPYRGPGRTLYRGESINAHQSRTYGWAWTGDIGVAHVFARRPRIGIDGVLLEVDAPASAIICAFDEHEHLRKGENEFIVDRRILAQQGAEIRVVERFHQAPTDAS